jgi:hypothetical protein
MVQMHRPLSFCEKRNQVRLKNGFTGIEYLCSVRAVTVMQQEVTYVSNTLYCDILCPKCGKKVESGIGFRVGSVDQHSYKIGERLTWDGPRLRPSERPKDGNLKTVGYFECDNLNCPTWADCYPEVQEALITIRGDVIAEVQPITHKPNQIDFDIIEPNE